MIVHIHVTKKYFPHLHFKMIRFSSGGVSTCLEVGRGTIIFFMQLLNKVSSGLEQRSSKIKDGLVYSGLQYSNCTRKKFNYKTNYIFNCLNNHPADFMVLLILCRCTCRC